MTYLSDRAMHIIGLIRVDDVCIYCKIFFSVMASVSVMVLVLSFMTISLRISASQCVHEKMFILSIQKVFVFIFCIIIIWY